MKNYQTLGEALDNLDKPKLTKIETVGMPNHGKVKKKRIPAFSTNTEKTDNKLKGKIFYINGYKYTVESVNKTDDILKTKEGNEFKYSSLIDTVKFEDNERVTKARFIGSSGEDSLNNTIDIDDEKINFKSDEDAEKVIKTGAATTYGRLSRDVKNVKEIYVKKVPEYKTLSTQIEILKQEKESYLLLNNKLHANKCEDLIRELELTKIKIDKAFALKSYTEADKAETEEKRKSLKLDPEYNELDNRYKAINEAIKENSLSDKMTKIRDYRKNLEIMDNMNVDGFVTLEEELNGNSDYAVYEEEYMLYCGSLAKIINEHVQMYVAEHEQRLYEIESKDEDDLTEDDLAYDSKFIPGLEEIYLDYMNVDAFEISKMKQATINKLLKPILSVNVAALKEEKDIVFYQRNFKRQELLQGGDSVTNYLIDMFDFSEASTIGNDSFKSKEVIAAVHADFAYRIAYKEASALGALHNLDEAISGAMFGLSQAIDTWYKIQTEIPTTPAEFNNILYMYVKPQVRRSLITISNVVASGSAISNASHQHKKMIDAAIRSQPSLKHLPREMVQDMVESAMGSTNYNEIKATVSETVLSGVIGGDESDSVDVWSQVGGSDDVDIVEAQNYYKQVIASISGLLEEFDVAEDKSGRLYTKNNKMFDVYDRIILFMKFGFTYDYMYQGEGDAMKSKRIDNTNEAGVRLEATNEECAEACMRYAASIGDVNKTFSTNAISTRYTKMMKQKLPLLLEHKPELEKGLKYMLMWVKANPEAIRKMSGFREEKTLMKTRQELIEIYSDQLDKVGNTKLIDGRTLMDTNGVSQQNNLLGDDIDLMFNELMI